MGGITLNSDFSVVMAVHNEAATLEKCLNSVVSLNPEIIVVDGESTDDTVKIAKKFKAIVISTTNKSNFHINKQLAIDSATGKLILQLDADEVVDSELQTFIQNLIDQQIWLKHQGPNAWQIKRKNYFLNRFLSKGGQYPDKLTRLFISGMARLPQKDVHEQMIVNGLVSEASGHLNHFANPNFGVYLQKFNRYTDFRAQTWATDKYPVNFLTGVANLIWMPIHTFVKIYFRHRGYVDGLAGFIFAVMSGLHFSVAFLKYLENSYHE